MNNYPRLFAYVSGAFTFGVIIYIFTNLFYPFAQRPDWIGSLALLCYGLVYMSLNAALARRFIRRTNANFNFPYALIPILLAPTFGFVHFQEKFPTLTGELFFFIMITIGSVVGVYLGIKAGFKKRDALVQEHLKKQQSQSK